MKKLFLGLAIASMFFYSSCENEELNPNYPFTIVVKTQSDSLLVQNVRVEVAAPVPGNKVWLDGRTNTNGEVDFEYDQAATLGVRASRGDRPDYTWIGCTEIRLLPNEHVTKTVYIQPYDSLLVGCSFD
ncbi:MAG: hypothetical protein ACPGVV_02725 [Croceimicrobium sp.]|nr:hypothetical protein [Bacteroidota bacterium]